MDLKSSKPQLTIHTPNVKLCINTFSPIKVKIPADDGPVEVNVISSHKHKHNSSIKYHQTNSSNNEDLPRISTNLYNSSYLSHSDDLNPRYGGYNTHSSISLPEPYKPATLYPPGNNYTFYPSNQSCIIPESGFNTSSNVPPPHISPVKPMTQPVTNQASSLNSDYLSSLPHYTFHAEDPVYNYNHEYIPSHNSFANTSSIPINNSESLSSSSFSIKDHPLSTYQPTTRSIMSNYNSNIKKEVNSDNNERRPSITSNQSIPQPNYSTYTKYNQQQNNSSSPPPSSFIKDEDLDLPPNLDEIMKRYSPEKNEKDEKNSNDEFTTENIINNYAKELEKDNSNDEDVYIPNNKNYLAELSNSHSVSDNKEETSSSGENSVTITPKDSQSDLELNINNEAIVIPADLK